MTSKDQDIEFRFSGLRRLYGAEDFQKIARGHVLVVGLGGVGSWTVESLVRSGVGTITLVDFDDICVSNTNRQLHALDGNVGKLKTHALLERAKKINPHVNVNVIDEAYSPETEDLLFTRPVDVVVDAIDRSLTKFHLVRACQVRKIPVVVAGSAGGRWDPSLIQKADLSKCSEDKLLAILRKDLRRQANFPRKGTMGVSCVFSTEKIKFVGGDGQVSLEKPDHFRKTLDCTTGLGTVTHVTGTFGFFLGHLAIEKLRAQRSVRGCET